MLVPGAYIAMDLGASLFGSVLRLVKSGRKVVKNHLARHYAPTWFQTFITVPQNLYLLSFSMY
jgi:hypothetical protein